MKLYRFGQQWINLDHVARIDVTIPDPTEDPPVKGAFKFTFANGETHIVESDWKDMASFSKVFNPFSQTLKAYESPFGGNP